MSGVTMKSAGVLLALFVAACGSTDEPADVPLGPFYLNLFCSDLQSAHAELIVSGAPVSNAPSIAGEWAPRLRGAATRLRGQGQVSIDADVLANRLEIWQTLEPGTIGDTGYAEAFMEESDSFITRYCPAE